MTEAQKETAFRLGFHQMTPRGMAKMIHVMLAACSQYKFEELKKSELPALFYVKSNSSYSQAETLVVYSVTAKAGQATASRWPNPAQSKIYKSNHKYEIFYALTPDLQNLLGVTHEQIVTAAVETKLQIPVQVRILYPQLFIEIPEGIETERVRKALSPDWTRADENGLYTTPEMVIAAIEEEHTAIKRWTELNSLFVKQPDPKIARKLVEDNERIAQSHFHNIEFYRWLEPLVQPGAVFGTEKKLSGEPAFDRDEVPRNFVTENRKW